MVIAIAKNTKSHLEWCKVCYQVVPGNCRVAARWRSLLAIQADARTSTAAVKRNLCEIGRYLVSSRGITIGIHRGLMEGVVLVEMSSGALHYTRSFSKTFDVRHPKTERLNFGALIFALQNFAGSSIRPTDNNEGPDAPGNGVAEIAMFSTPVESMVFATTLSKILVVLFTTPEFDADLAKWVVRRVAFNYENSETELMTSTNQVPRRFHHALSQAVDESVERELVRLSERILISPEPESDNGVEKSGAVLFLFFYYSLRMDDSASDDESENGGKAVSSIAREEEFRIAVRADNPTVSEIPQSSRQNLNLRNMMAAARALMGNPIKREMNNKKKIWKKTRWRSKNAVMDLSEPNELQRVIEVLGRERKAVVMEPRRPGTSSRIADVLIPFVEVLGSSLFSSALSNSNVVIHRSQKCYQLMWKNIPGVSATKGEPQAGANVLAWKSGPCCIFYPTTAMCIDHDNNSRVRLAVAALFDKLQPLLKAKTKVT